MRIINIINTDLLNDKLKLEETLERTINSRDIEISNTIYEVKDILREISLINGMIEMWDGYTVKSTNHEEGDNNKN